MICAALAFPAVFAVLGISGISSAQPDPGQGEYPLTRKPKVEAVRSGYGGTVTSIGKDSITVKRGDGNPALTFPVSRILAEGSYPRGEPQEFSYRLSDIRIGDEVGIRYDRIDGVNVCKALLIHRRPGGEVPPANRPPDDDGFYYHEWANIRRRCEAKGVPYPPTSAFPWLEDHIAPPPRVVQQSIPRPGR
ncbi:MAG: hypothetical protein JWO38_4794 [Gemmataceae bacterium]|nr:hypothetical protein [Gemmataceae bacterium]